MRPLLLALLALSGLAFASSATSLPQGDDDRFVLGMTRPALEKRLTERGVSPISEFNNVLATTSDDRAVEYERYRFVPSSRPDQPEMLAEVTIAWRVPYDRAAFESAAGLLRQRLGDPTDEQHAPDGSSSRVVWADGLVTVRLAARWTEQQDPATDRMLLTWTDMRLYRAADAVRRPAKKKSK